MAVPTKWGTTWKGLHLRWLDGQNFAHAAQRFAFQEMLNAMRVAVERIAMTAGPFGLP